MATLFKKKFAFPMPPGAETFQRAGKPYARWVNGKGQERVSEVLRDGRVQFVSDYWYMSYNDPDGRPKRKSTKCRHKDSAMKVLADTVAAMEKIHAGIVSPREHEISTHVHRPLLEHLEAYLVHLSRKRLRGRKVSPAYCRNTEGRLKRLFKECTFRRMGDITRHTMETWLEDAEEKNMAASTRNDYLISINAFCNWAVKDNRLSTNPVSGIGKADRSSSRKRIRRALRAEEVTRLLEATKRRPIAEAGRKPVKLPKEDQCGRSSWTFEKLTDQNFEKCYADGLESMVKKPNYHKKLELLGQERALFYLMAVSTGLRRNEQASLTMDQLHLDAVPTAYLELKAEDAKNAKAATIPLRKEVVDELKSYLKQRGQATPDTSLFINPPTVRIFDADCQAAGIPKKDDRGHVVDIHALRHTFGTYLSASGAHPRTAMAAMRHSRMELTMNYYTDPVLLDVAGAVDALPRFSA